MSVSAIGGVAAAGFTPLVTPQLDGAQAINGAGTTGAAGGTSAANGEFNHLVLDGIDRLQTVQGTSDKLAVGAATGDLDAIHHYTIAASEAAVTTQLTVAVRNKALEAFNEIMRMPV
jgi:flagellar hook-basal body complex protein FliE